MFLVIRPVIAMVISLALSQANGLGLVCAVNCSRVNSARNVHKASQELALHHYSHAGNSSPASACCSTAARITRSLCSQPEQLSAVEVRYRISPEWATAAEYPASRFARSAPSSQIFSSASPPTSLAKPAPPTLRI